MTEDKEQQYRIIFETAGDGMIISDLETDCVVDANPSAIAMHGYTREEFIGLHLTAYVHPDSQRLFTKTANMAKPGGKAELPAVHLHKDGSSFFVDERRTAIPFQTRSCMLSIVRDVDLPPKYVPLSMLVPVDEIGKVGERSHQAQVDGIPMNCEV